jgi:hypothetical protein
MRQNSRAATWVLKNFPGVNPRTPNKGERREKGGWKGEGMGKGRKEGLGKGEGIGWKVKEGEMFQPPKCVVHAPPMLLSLLRNSDLTKLEFYMFTS